MWTKKIKTLAAATTRVYVLLLENLRQEFLRPFFLRMAEDVVRFAFFDDVAAIDEENPVGYFAGDLRMNFS